MGVRQRHGQGVGGISLQFSGNSEQHTHHVLDLALVRRTTTDDRLLDFPCGVLGKAESAMDHGTDCRAARLSEFQC